LHLKPGNASATGQKLLLLAVFSTSGNICERRSDAWLMMVTDEGELIAVGEGAACFATL